MSGLFLRLFVHKSRRNAHSTIFDKQKLSTTQAYTICTLQAFLTPKPSHDHWKWRPYKVTRLFLRLLVCKSRRNSSLLSVQRLPITQLTACICTLLWNSPSGPSEPLVSIYNRMTSWAFNNCPYVIQVLFANIYTSVHTYAEDRDSTHVYIVMRTACSQHSLPIHTQFPACR